MQYLHIFAIKMLYLHILAITDLLPVGLFVCLCVCPFLEKRSTIIIFINTSILTSEKRTSLLKLGGLFLIHADRYKDPSVCQYIYFDVRKKDKLAQIGGIVSNSCRQVQRSIRLSVRLFVCLFVCFLSVCLYVCQSLHNQPWKPG